MFKRSLVYVLLVISFAFNSCKKEDVAQADYQSLGTAAHNILSAFPYSGLHIEIQYMVGYPPDSASIDNLVNFLKKYINKPDGIQVTQQEIAASGKPVLSIDDIVSIEKKNRTVFSQNNTLAVHILITDGDYDKANILATSYWNTSFCVFGKTVNEDSGSWGFTSLTQLLTTLFEHEFGHLMGLVNQGSPMQTNHIDPANGAHCINPHCLMYYDVEKSTSGGNLFSVPTLDAECEADLKANGGK
ncbi:MAG TPA: hypothetical protein VN726_10915 [Hanamia sp.]|nr:hypothetical protein [Hanamia sp.]